MVDVGGASDFHKLLARNSDVAGALAMHEAAGRVGRVRRQQDLALTDQEARHLAAAQAHRGVPVTEDGGFRHWRRIAMKDAPAAERVASGPE